MASVGYPSSMRTTWFLVLTLSLSACGGGGGGGAAVPPVAAAARLLAEAIEIGPAVTVADVTVSLAKQPEAAPALLEAHIELPPELSLPNQDRLTAAAPLVTLDGNFVDERFVVICGDASNQNAVALPNGELFRLRVTPTLPRKPGSYTITLRNLRAATSDGSNVPLESETVSVSVTIL